MKSLINRNTSKGFLTNFSPKGILKDNSIHYWFVMRHMYYHLLLFPRSLVNKVMKYYSHGRRPFSKRVADLIFIYMHI